ncbi:MAG: hypothetical protein Q8M37_04770 [Nevskia sp.]|nr:hypothetical protein [Nevskia sp.]
MNLITTDAGLGPSTTRRAESDSENRGLQMTAAIMAALALHMSFAVALIRSGTDAERIYAQRSVVQARAVADLGTLPAIRVVGRRAG